MLCLQQRANILLLSFKVCRERYVHNAVFTVQMVFQFVPPVEPFAAHVTLHVVVPLAFLAVAHHSLLVFVALPAVPASGRQILATRCHAGRCDEEQAWKSNNTRLDVCHKYSDHH